jgi:hypothetical protein
LAYQAVQILLASFTVAAFAALQLGLTGPSDRRYLLANLIGAGGLLIVAIRSVELGFVITNGLWVLVSAAGLVGSGRWLQQTRRSRRAARRPACRLESERRAPP